jgi:NTE family protein
MTRRKLAFVLAGGGARGALQAGALRALHEAGYRPDLVCGTSIGALNAAILAVNGFTPDALVALDTAWRDAARANLLPRGYLGPTVRAFLGRNNSHLQESIRAFLTEHGVKPELTFGALTGVPTRIVAADVRGGQTVVYGADPKEYLLEAVLASSAIPLWVDPLETNGRRLLDGGAVSNLPIEPAMAAGATEIIALDLADPRPPPGLRALSNQAFQLLYTMHRRQAELETALAAARGVTVHKVTLRCAEHPVALWDFPYAPQLIDEGHALMQEELARWERARSWHARLRFRRRPI